MVKSKVKTKKVKTKKVLKKKKPALKKVKVKVASGLAKANKEDISLIKKITTKLLKEMGMEKIKVDLSQKAGEAVRLNIDCADPGILIGNRGETISSLQLILSLMVYKKLGRWQRVIVNISDYLEKRAESLEKMALETAQRVKFSKEGLMMPFLNSAERRVIHMALADNPDVVTESIGEGRERRLVIKPKSG